MTGLYCIFAGKHYLQSEMSSDYRYRPLSNPRNIKIVILSAGRKEDKISCQMIHASLDRQPVFEAISYVWGDHKARRQVNCDTGTLNITVNLFSALKALRREDEPRAIWVDAVCELTEYTRLESRLM